MMNIKAQDQTGGVLTRGNADQVVYCPSGSAMYVSGGARRRRGSALFFVAVSLVLMAILGTTYIQLARMDRVATRRYVKGDIGAVMEASIKQIQTVLYQDIVDDKGNFFNGSEDARELGGADEIYDYPWTNKFVFHEVVLKDGDLALTSGGEKDDRWLASTMPDFDTDPDKPRWRHITNLNGIFLRIPKPGGATEPQENLVWLKDDADYTAEGPEYTFLHSLLPRYTITDTSTEDGDRELIITNRGDETGDSTTMEVGNASWHAPGVDSDGDGIADSRWTWAPIRRIGDVNYVMAVRIIDNSSMPNVNVALGLAGDGGVYPPEPGGDNAPRWRYPTELDLTRFVYGMGEFADDESTYISELKDLLKHRLNLSVSATLPTSWGSTAGRREHYWLEGPRLYDQFGSGYNSIHFESELDLRYRNGLNNPDLTSVIESATQGMPTLTRASATDELSYDDFPGVTAGSNAEKYREYFEQEPRHQMTVTSGAAIFAPPLASAGSEERPLKKDINALISIGATETPRYASLSDEIRRIYNSDGFAGYKDDGDDDASDGDDGKGNRLLSSFSDGHGVDGHDTSTSPYPSDWTTADWADQFAACIVDYADADNQITKIDRSPDGPITYGLEALPYITEVYAQATYTTPGDPGDDRSIKWTRSGHPGFVIEIRNPFRKTIPITNVHVYVDGESWGTLDTLVDDDSSDPVVPKTELEPHEVLLLYRDAGGDDDTDMERMWNDPEEVDPEVGGIKPIPQLIADKHWPDVGGEIFVELRAEDSTGTVFDWAYTRAPSEGMVREFEQAVSSDPGDVEDYRQAFSIGNCNGINTMLRDESDFAVHVELPSITDAESDRTRKTNLDGLGLASKSDALSGTGAEGPPDDVLTDDVEANQILIGNYEDDQLVQIGELAHITVLGPNPDLSSMSIADAWHGGGGTPKDVQKFMMVFNTNELIVGGPDPDGGEIGSGDSSNNLAVPHAVALLDRFTTISPAADGQDNDGDGDVDTADPDEQFVPGTLNLNTAPAHILRLHLPIPKEDIRNQVVNAIVKYRDNQHKFRVPDGALEDSPYKPANDTRGGIGTSSPINIKNYRDYPGIAMLGELMQVVDRSEVTDTDLEGEHRKDTLDVLARNGDDDEALNGVVVDFNNPDTEADGIIDDREEEAMIARWLMQTCSVRSDIFTAYVLIRGYPSADFRLEPVESARYFAVFDRSRVTDASDTVRVLGVYRVE